MRQNHLYEPYRTLIEKMAPIAQDDKHASYTPATVRRHFMYNAPAPFQHLKEENEIAMEIPENLDAFLATLLQPNADEEPRSRVQLDSDERAFVEHILDSVTTGSKGIFVVLHPNDRMQYMLLNANRASALALLANVMQRAAEALEADVG
jgi:hypothetical protein